MESTNALLTIPINPSSFPAKLWYLVNNPKTQSINWDSKGKGILIDQRLFEAELLSPSKKLQSKSPYFFKTVNFQSFVRQLNLYGFKKRLRSQGYSEMQIENCFIRSRIHHFQSPNFIQDHPELLANLKRLTSINKAKLKAGIEIKCRPPGRLHRRLLNSNGRSSAVKENGFDSVGHQHLRFERKTTTVCHQYSSNHSQQVKKCKTLPLPSQAWIPDSSNASSIRPRYTNKGMPASMLHHYPTDSPYVGPSSAVHSTMAPGKFVAFMPSPSPYQYLPVCQCCPSGSLDSNVVCYHHSAASYPFYGYYPSFSVNYGHPCGHHPDRPASDTPETKSNDINLNTVFKMTDELQGSPPMRMVKVATPDAHLNTSNSRSFTSCTTASFLYNTQASTSDSSSATAWAQHVGVKSSVPENVPSALASHHAHTLTDRDLRQEPRQSEGAESSHNGCCC